MLASTIHNIQMVIKQHFTLYCMYNIKLNCKQFYFIQFIFKSFSFGFLNVSLCHSELLKLYKKWFNFDFSTNYADLKIHTIIIILHCLLSLYTNTYIYINIYFLLHQHSIQPFSIHFENNIS